MISRSRILVGMLFLLAAGLAVFMGCSRELPVPLRGLQATRTATSTSTLAATNTMTSTDTPLLTSTFTDTPTITDTPTATPTPDYIDNVEDGDGQIMLRNGRSGYWYTYVGTGVAWPPAPYTVSAPGNSLGTTTYAARLTGNCSDYIGTGFNWINPKTLYDITQGGMVTGIRFYAMIGAGGATAVRFKMPNVDTDPSGGNCSGQPGGCYNDFGHDYTFTNSWAQYSVNFSTFTQQTGFGWAPPGGFNQTQVYACQWQLGSAATVDLWVDDIEFF